MRELYLIRKQPSDQGTEGWILGDTGTLCCTIELPWKDNKTNISCIPFGEYIATPYRSRKFGEVWLIQNVQGRTWILTHTGNYAGDKSKGFKTHSAGCIIIGSYHGRLNGQRAVLASRSAMRKFRNYIGRDKFKLIVTELP